MNELEKFLEYTLIKIKSYELTVAMLIVIAVVIVLNYLFLFAVKYFILKKQIQNDINRNRLLSIYLLVKYISWIFVIAIIFGILKIKLTFFRIVHFFDDGISLYVFVHGRRGIVIPNALGF